uniref:Cation-transporting P-type ATPase N-terminal domain-containing protein n=1 Tax=Timema monikensis TaxID=170555 RepID=A0A7R9HLL4_9NEOP|nr:unnamed protein product [Timema monikensis]
MDDAHAKTVDEVLNYFGTDSDKGLAQDQVKRNQEKYGLNGNSQHNTRGHPLIPADVTHCPCDVSGDQLGHRFTVTFLASRSTSGGSRSVNPTHRSLQDRWNCSSYFTVQGTLVPQNSRGCELKKPIKITCWRCVCAAVKTYASQKGCGSNGLLFVYGRCAEEANEKIETEVKGGPYLRLCSHERYNNRR